MNNADESFNPKLRSTPKKIIFLTWEELNKLKDYKNEAKQTHITDYLHSLGYAPAKQQGKSLWYKSPFRDEHDPSFKVNTDRNSWYDFGAGKGGNIIALAQELHASDSLPYLLDRIVEQSPAIRSVSFSFGRQSSTQPSFQQSRI